MQQSALMPSSRRLRPAALGSPRLTLWLIALLASGVIANALEIGTSAWALAVPLALLALNLAAAIATHAAFRSQPALLAFHLALLAVVVLAAAGRLSFLKGTLELSVGETFSGALIQDDRGPLHGGVLERAAFTNAGFTVDYEPGLKRARTRNRVAYGDAGGAPREVLIGDDTPLKLAGYRFYTTSNKGFAPEFVWIPANGGAAVRGTIHLPSFPAQLTQQNLDWVPPGSSLRLQTHLEIDERIVDLEGRWTLRPPSAHRLSVASDTERAELRPGEAHRFREGTLQYVGLRLWMGYAVFHDWTLPWLLAACALAAGALAWHFATRFLRTPWHAACDTRRA